MIKDMSNSTTFEIMNYFESLKNSEDQSINIILLDSDIEKIGYKSLVDLAQLYFMKMLTSKPFGENGVELVFQRLNKNRSFHNDSNDTSEKYGTSSQFFTIDKSSKFSFLYHYTKALEFIDISSKQKILNLGVNKGDEFSIIKDMISLDDFESKKFVGIDYSKSAIEYAQDILPQTNLSFLAHDINEIDSLSLGKFDLIISIGTLQSVNINFKVTFMNLIQNYLEKDGALILGFPNCRWIDGEMVYGASVPNYNFSELGTVIKDIHFCKKYLQQKKYRVTITGKDYLFLTARKIVIKE